MKQLRISAEGDLPALLDDFGRAPTSSIQLELGGDNLVLTKSFRFLKGHRLTALAQWRGQSVIVKCFFGSNRLKHFQREQNGVHALEKSQINTASSLALGQDDLGTLSVIVFEYLYPSVTLRDLIFSQKNDHSRVMVLKKLARLFASLHQAGLLQPDPHLDNFIEMNGELYVIDAGQIEGPHLSLDWSAVFANVALLFAQLPVIWDHKGYEALHEYLKGVAVAPKHISNSDWEMAIFQQRQWRQQRFIDKKVFRDCSAYVTRKLENRFCVFDRRLVNGQLQDEILSQTDSLSSSSTKQSVLKLGLEPLNEWSVLYFPKPKIHRAMKWSKAAEAWRNAQRLKLLGIPGLTAAGFAEKKYGPVRGATFFWFATPGGDPLDCILSNPETTLAKLQRDAELVAAMYVLFARCGIQANQLKPNSIWVDQDHAFVLDLHFLKAESQTAISIERFLSQMDSLHAELMHIKPWGAEWVSMLKGSFDYT